MVRAVDATVADVPLGDALDAVAAGELVVFAGGTYGRYNSIVF